MKKIVLKAKIAWTQLRLNQVIKKDNQRDRYADSNSALLMAILWLLAYVLFFGRNAFVHNRRDLCIFFVFGVVFVGIMIMVVMMHQQELKEVLKEVLKEFLEIKWLPEKIKKYGKLFVPLINQPNDEKIAALKERLSRLKENSTLKNKQLILTQSDQDGKSKTLIHNSYTPLITEDLKIDDTVKKITNKANFLMKRIDPHAQTSAYNFIVQSMTSYLPDLIKLYHITPIEVLKLKSKNMESVYDIILGQLSVVHEGLNDLEGEFLKMDHRQLRVSEKYLAQVLVTHRMIPFGKVTNEKF